MLTPELKAGDLAWCAREAVRKWGRAVLLVTVTAPGSDVLPVDSHGRCRFDALSSWSSDLLVRWHRLSSRAQRGSRSPVLVRRWDVQERGAPHLHLVVQDTTAGRLYAQRVKNYGGSYGFGFIDIQEKSGDPVAVAVYVAGYVTRNLNREAYGSSLLPRSVLYVSREWAYRSGADMSVARDIRRNYVFGNVTREVGQSAAFRTDDVHASKVLWHSRAKKRGLDRMRPSVISWDEEWQKRKLGRETDGVVVHGDGLLGEGREESRRVGRDVPLRIPGLSGRESPLGMLRHVVGSVITSMCATVGLTPVEAGEGVLGILVALFVLGMVSSFRGRSSFTLERQSDAD